MSGGDWKSMFKAILDGNLELVRTYLNMGVDPNYQHPEYMASPLVESIRFKHLEITKLILEKGGNPLVKEVMGGDTAVSVAKQLNQQSIIDLLNQYIGDTE